jgi:putative redox protein
MNYICKNIFMVNIELTRVEGDFGFEARDASGHVVRLDSNPEHGGKGFGVRPMQLLLMGLGGCAGIDIVSILKKQRQIVEGFDMKIEGEREPGVEPSLWKTVQIVFELTGNIDLEKARKACALSMDKYCSVAETIRRGGAEISWDVKVLAPQAETSLP